MRQLATLRTVSALIPIAGADKIELAKIDGWQCVVKKGEFKVGEAGVYFEIDSQLPANDARFAFLSKGKVVEHFRIKTIRLKGQLSQGLLLPMEMLDKREMDRLASGETLDVILGVSKYEPPVPIGGKQKGTFPTHLVPKTDQERIQNIPDVLNGCKVTDFEVTEKLDGTSCTIWMHLSQDDPKIAEVNLEDQQSIDQWKNISCGVASRNWEMQKDDSNVYAAMCKKYDLQSKFWNLGRNIAIQGEIIGPGVQGNKYKLAEQDFYVFDIYDIDAKKYLGSSERLQLVELLQLKHVPILTFDAHTDMTLDSVLSIADGPSQLNHSVEREGLVFKANDGSKSFKAISNQWLLKYE